MTELIKQKLKNKFTCLNNYKDKNKSLAFKENYDFILKVY